MQEIIVYRNPYEAAFWNLVLSSPNTFPIFLGVISFGVSFLVSTIIIDKIRRKLKANLRSFIFQYEGYILLFISLFVSYTVTSYFWI